MRIQVDMKCLSDSPHDGSEAIPFIFDQTVVTDLVNDLISANPTCFLVSGYRGAGKSSFVKKVQKTIPQDKGIIFVYTSFAKYKSHSFLLRKLIRGLYQSFISEENKHYYEELKKGELNDNIAENERISLLLERLYDKTFNETSENSSSQTKETNESIREVDQIQLVLFIASLVYTFFSVISPGSKVGDLFLAFSVLIFSGGSLATKFLKLTKKKTKLTSSTEDFLRKSLYDDEIADYHFLNLIEGLSKRDFKLVFVLDELDKVSSSDVDALVNEMKPFLLCGKANFLVVAGQDTFYKYKASLFLDDAVLSTLFSRLIHIPLLSIVDLENLFSHFVKLPAEADKAQYTSFRDSLIIRSKRIPRKFISLLRQHIIWEDNCSYLNISDETSSLQRSSEILKKLQQIDEEIATLYSDGVRDYLNMQLYIIAETVMDMTWRNCSFTLAGLKKEYLKSENAQEKQFGRPLDEFLTRFLEEIESINLATTVIQGADGKTYSLIDPQKAAPNLEADEKSQNIIDLFYEFRNVLSAVYRSSLPPNNHNNLSFGQIVERMVNDKDLNADWVKVDLLRHFLDEADDLLAEEETRNQVIKEIRRHKVNFLKHISEVLERFAGASFFSIDHRLELSMPIASDIYDIKVLKQYASVNLFVDVKYRRKSYSMKDIIQSAIKTLEQGAEQPGKKNKVLMLVYSNSGPSDIGRNKYKFKQNINENFSSFKDKIFFIPVSINKLETLKIDLEEIWLTLFESETFEFKFFNQPIQPAHPDIDDHYYPDVWNLEKVALDIYLQPKYMIQHWRFGVKFSNDSEFPNPYQRHGAGYPSAHLEKNPNDANLRLSYYDETGKQNFCSPTLLSDYENQPLIIRISFIDDASILDVLDENSVSILEQKLVLGNYKFCKVFAWADNRNRFEIETKTVMHPYDLGPSVS